VGDDSLELVKAATEGAAEGTVRGLLAPITDFVSAVFGAPTKEVGSYLVDTIRFRRLQMQIRVFTDAKEMCETAGIDPQHVDWKILVPLLDAAANEDEREDSMVGRWAALLANAAAGDHGVVVMPGFPVILAQILPIEALILETLYRLQDDDWSGGRFVHDSTRDRAQDLSVQEGEEGIPVADLARECGVSFDETFLVNVDDLERHGLIYVPVPATYGGLNELLYRQGGLVNGTAELTLTFYGRSFVNACQPPAAAHEAKEAVEPPG